MASEKLSARPPRLPIGVRKILGTVILLTGLTAYALGVVWLAINYLPEHWAVQGIFYFAAGIAWAFPAKPLIAWAQRPDGPRPQ